jgi:hypothetical protein
MESTVLLRRTFRLGGWLTMAQAGSFPSSLQGAAVAAACLALSIGCAHRPPLDQQTQIPIERLRPDYRLQQDKVTYNAVATGQDIRPDGTFETIYKVPTPASGAQSSDSCTSKFCQGAAGLAGYFAPVVILPVAIVSLPFIAAYELLNRPDTASGGSARTAIDPAALAKQEATLSSLKENADLLATVALDERFSAEWDAAYISALNQALGWSAPPGNSLPEPDKLPRNGKPPSAATEGYFGAGISRMVLLNSKAGEQTLVLCARSFIRVGNARARNLETCQSGTIDLAVSHQDRQRLQAVLMEKGRQLASVQAKALRGQATIRDAMDSDYVSMAGDRGNGREGLTYIGEIAASDFSPAGTLLIDVHRIQPVVGEDTRGTLLVNLDKLPDGSRRSIEQDIAVACSTGIVTYKSRRTYDDWNSSLPIRSTAPSATALPPGPQLNAAVRMICEADSK